MTKKISEFKISYMCNDLSVDENFELDILTLAEMYELKFVVSTFKAKTGNKYFEFVKQDIKKGELK